MVFVHAFPLLPFGPSLRYDPYIRAAEKALDIQNVFAIIAPIRPDEANVQKGGDRPGTSAHISSVALSVMLARPMFHSREGQTR